jgi:nitroimidazol reductase NimA-like FMN-containing flavoprotein (pyridoxamine 5'-phosphate oxidase superfamily)
MRYGQNHPEADFFGAMQQKKIDILKRDAKIQLIAVHHSPPRTGDEHREWGIRIGHQLGLN